MTDSVYDDLREEFAQAAEDEANARSGDQSGVTKAVLALVYELRRQDIGAKIDALTAAVEGLNHPRPR